MSRQSPDWCHFGLREWTAKDLEDRKASVPCRGLQTINGLRVCNKAEHIDAAHAEGKQPA